MTATVDSLNSITIKSLLTEPSTVDKTIRQAWLAACLQVRPSYSISYFISHDDDQVAEAVLATYRHGLSQLEAGMPLAYVVGSQGFWRHEFMVNAHTLIPRPDTEILVETVLTLAQKRAQTTQQHGPNNGLRLLDLGTGSGCIAISLAAEHPTWQVVATDFSAQALAVAKHNAEQIGTQNVIFYQGSWFEALPTECKKFDIIVSNPPYIDPEDAHLSALTAEPITALVAAHQGLADIEAIVQGSGRWLTAQGLLAVEHGYDQREPVQQIFFAHGFGDVTTVKDFGGNDRITYGYLS